MKKSAFGVIEQPSTGRELALALARLKTAASGNISDSRVLTMRIAPWPWRQLCERKA